MNLLKHYFSWRQSSTFASSPRVVASPQVAVRNVRRDATKDLQKLEKAGSSKDIIADYCDTIDNLTKKYVEKIETAVAEKEKDIMTV